MDLYNSPTYICSIIVLCLLPLSFNVNFKLHLSRHAIVMFSVQGAGSTIPRYYAGIMAGELRP